MRKISAYWNRVFKPLLTYANSQNMVFIGKKESPLLEEVKSYCKEKKAELCYLPSLEPFEKVDALWIMDEGEDLVKVWELSPLPFVFLLGISQKKFESLKKEIGETAKDYKSLYIPFGEGLGLIYDESQYDERTKEYIKGLVLSPVLRDLAEEEGKNKVSKVSLDDQERDYFLQRIQDLQKQLENTNEEVEKTLQSTRFRMGSIIADSLSSPKQLIKAPKKIWQLIKKGDNEKSKVPLASGTTVEETFVPSKYSKEEILALHKEKLKEPWKGKGNPLVSIIVVNKDGLDKLKVLFESLQKEQFYSNYEVIVVDNGSKDGSLDFLKKQKEKMLLQVIENKENASFSKANNQGVEIAQGEYLVFMNNDIEVTQGWLDELLYTMDKTKNPGAIGAKLVYPQIPENTINKGKSFLLQHTGIDFREEVFLEKPFYRPFNMDNGKQVFDEKEEKPVTRMAVTAAVLLVKKALFQKAGGFEEGYVYGYEDVDLCLKIHRLGYQNIYCPTSLLFHYEFGTQSTSAPKKVVKRRLSNMTLFQDTWQSYLEKELFYFKVRQLKKEGTPLKVAFMVSQSNPGTMAGDYFTAMELGNALKEKNCEVAYIERGQKESWYDLPPDIDLLIAMIHDYDVNRIRKNKPKYTLAWMRNWFSEWCENPGVIDYDSLFASSEKAAAFVKSRLTKEVKVFPIATNHHTFGKVDSLPQNPYDQEQYEADYIFTGSYWKEPRDITSFLHPEKIPFTGKIYGANWEEVAHLKIIAKGAKAYSEMPTLYQYTKVVLDDANSKTKSFGAVNSRVFDALAAGRLVLTNGTIGAKETFEGLLPTYESQEELEKKLTYYLTHEKEREELTATLQTFVLAYHTYEKRAEELLSFLEEKGKKDLKKIAIMISAPNHREIHQWGDYHFAKSLGEAFKEEGFTYEIRPMPQWKDPFEGKYVLFLRGLRSYEPLKEHINIMWNISHPQQVKKEEYNRYDRVCVASYIWAEKIKKEVKVPVEVLLQCTDEKLFYTPYQKEKNGELLFVGNARGVYRKILKDLLPTKENLQVYGSGWEEWIEKKYIKGLHIDNDKLGRAYQDCKILLNDHWEDMRDKGFIANRIFDGLAAGAFILSDSVEGLEETLPDCVATYDGSKKDLEEKIEYYLKTPEKREKMALKGQKTVLEEHTFSKRAKKLIAYYEEDEKMVFTRK